MDKLRIGTAGIPISTEPRNTVEGVKQVRKLGLEAMELEFVQSVNISEQKAPEVKRTAKENDIVLTCHGQYFINLNSLEKEKIEASKQRILKAARILDKCGGGAGCFHAAYDVAMPALAYKNIKTSLEEMVKKLKDEGVKV